MIKKSYSEIKVPCYYYLETGANIEHCEGCSFFNGYEKDGDTITRVDCLRNEVGQIHAHVTQFDSGDYVYKSRDYDENTDGPLSKPYNFCEKCCFNKRLKNGKDICLLRCGIDNESEVSNFICYEGEIWEKYEKVL